MRIALLSTSQTGGAGLAAIRCSEALASIGVSNDFFALPTKKATQPAGIQEIVRNPLEILQSKVLTVAQQILIQKGQDLLTPLSMEPRDVEKLTQSYDLVHLHSTYNILDKNGFRKLIESGTKVVITLHDQRWFTGGCHYSGACKEYENKCTKCPQATSVGKLLIKESLKRDLKNFSAYSNVKIISPSLWLANMARDSKLLENTNIEVIRNPIPAHNYEVSDVPRIGKEEADVSLKKIAFVSDNLQNPLKGLKVLLDAFNLMTDHEKSSYQLLLIGRNSPNITRFPVETTVITISSSEDLYSQLQLQDVLVVPSLQDNLPNVIGEAFSSGIKVIGSAIGGIPEVITSESGFVFESGNSRDLANKLLSFNKNYSRGAILDHFANNFNYSSVARKVEAVYRS